MPTRKLNPQYTAVATPIPVRGPLDLSTRDDSTAHTCVPYNKRKALRGVYLGAYISTVTYRRMYVQGTYKRNGPLTNTIHSHEKEQEHPKQSQLNVTVVNEVRKSNHQ